MPRLDLPALHGHPALPGHFPGQPIVPGVVLLTLARQAIEAASRRRMNGLPTAKFLSPAGPQDALQLDFQLGEDSARFEILSGERRIASGRFTLV
ncbi:MAG: beta-hydroxyacyl-ACP dehydratase [Candidatus Dactylopiibacterium carminicum]|uniref:Beta-hydroxyacyl-ACP dehydratase n=1 Tax=Candidatus Dactylopiibacterium carminicum TaxID=857335 RepID=A0A272EWT6_9RHOO|nr:beta-hydroxyacyl-ACP dehydratase [Candidatus Dactylopiibacterium carminicum]KAF7600036.1 beta-hydroxyacyl-ACP dehydratase [Candidatus Dactylopiibacterium carminicum]PAS94574.1 MAG: beta-hydroxyacyl-ACP dehydratase [Candidatus Dactylopiibacterium carminicum]PAS97613.1 MAG: beta-hydroxyacyl-ACP dehydratase [Candidatus Dactylopiibacterium carminicum]PAT00040.1 MAG: hypothetical protein BSR46_04690 [Candidatus Dactylopiibacterium carminicum]